MQSVPATAGTLLRTRDAGGFRLTECTYRPSFSIPRHQHELASLSFAVKGGFHERSGATSFDCGPYDVVVKPPEERHSNRYGPGGARCLLIEVSRSRLAELQPVTELLARPSRLGGRGVATLAMRAYRELLRNDTVSTLAIEGLILELITEASRETVKEAEPHWLAVVRDYVHAHWRNRIALDDLARAASVHSATVVRGFRAHLRCTPADYVRRIRLEHAERELARGVRSIADIALECGFYDQSHLTRVIRRYTGMTPMEYRRENRG